MVSLPAFIERASVFHELTEGLRRSAVVVLAGPRLTSEPHDEAFFWATHQGAEIDLILRRGDRLLGIECKRTDAPGMTPSIRIARADLGLTHVAVLYPGSQRFTISEGVEAVPLEQLGKGQAIFPKVSF